MIATPDWAAAAVKGVDRRQGEYATAVSGPLGGATRLLGVRGGQRRCTPWTGCYWLSLLIVFCFLHGAQKTAWSRLWKASGWSPPTSLGSPLRPPYRRRFSALLAAAAARPVTERRRPPFFLGPRSRAVQQQEAVLSVIRTAGLVRRPDSPQVLRLDSSRGTRTCN